MAGRDIKAFFNLRHGLKERLRSVTPRPPAPLRGEGLSLRMIGRDRLPQRRRNLPERRRNCGASYSQQVPSQHVVLHTLDRVDNISSSGALPGTK